MTTALVESPLTRTAGWSRMAPAQQAESLRFFAALSVRRQQFVIEYLVDLNATRAARRAGYRGDVENIGPRVRGQLAALIDPLVAAQQAHLAATSTMSKEELARHLTALIRYDIRACFDAEGRLKRIPELDDRTMVAVAGYDVTEAFEGTGRDRHQIGETTKLKFCSRVDAAQALMKLNGWGLEKTLSLTATLDDESTEMLLAMRDEFRRRLKARAHGRRPRRAEQAGHDATGR